MPTCELILGDALTCLREMESGSAHCVVTSPPYYGLRDYGVSGQIGLEETPAAYVARLVEVFREVRRVLRDDGTLWLNLGDSYATGAGSVGNCPGGGKQGERFKAIGPVTQPNRMIGRPGAGKVSGRGASRDGVAVPGVRGKQLLGIPWRVAFALQDDGWLLRSDIIWHKPNPMPESVRDRPTKSHEYVFLLSKQARYHYDADAVREPGSGKSCGNRSYKYHGLPGHETKQGILAVADRPWHHRNRRTVWTVATRPYKGAHFACFPPKLVEPCILAGTSERGCCAGCGAPWVRVVERQSKQEQPAWAGAGRANGCPAGGGHHGRTGQWSSTSETTGWRPSCDCPEAEPVPCTVLDPFAGACTTGLVALEHGKRFVGIELNAAYLDLARTRLAAAQAGPPLFAS